MKSTMGYFAIGKKRMWVVDMKDIYLEWAVVSNIYHISVCTTYLFLKYCIGNLVIIIPYVRIYITAQVGFHSLYNYSARNNSWPLAIFWPISIFSQSKSILVQQIYCTSSMAQQSLTYKMSYLQNTAD